MIFVSKSFFETLKKRVLITHIPFALAVLLSGLNFLMAALLGYLGYEDSLYLISQWYSLHGEALIKFHTLYSLPVYKSWVVLHLLMALCFLAMARVLKLQPNFFSKSIAYLKEIFVGLNNQWQSLNPAWKWAFCLLVIGYFAIQLFQIATVPLIEDEEASLEYFIKKGPAIIISYYPGPNNHLLYNVCCWPLHAIGFSDRWALRLPSLLIATLGIVILFLVLKRHLGPWPAIAGSVGFALYPHFFHYGHLGRGYAMGIVWLACMSLAFYAFTVQRRSYGPFYLGLVFGILAIATLPSNALYVALACIAVASFQRKLPLKFIKALITAAAMSALVYVPVFLFQGWTALTSNGWAKTYQQYYQSRSMLTYTKEVFEYLSVIELYWIWILAHGLVWFLFYLSKATIPKSVRVLGLAINLTAPILFSMILQAHAPSRVWMIHGVALFTVLMVLLGLIIQNLLQKKNGMH